MERAGAEPEAVVVEDGEEEAEPEPSR